MTLVVFSLFVCVPALADEGKDEPGKEKDRKPYSEKYDKKKDESGKGKYYGGMVTEKPIFSVMATLNWTYLRGTILLRANVAYGTRIALLDSNRLLLDAVRYPPGSWVITHPKDRPGYAHVTVYDPQHPGGVYVEGEFNIGSGTFIRVIHNR